MRRINLCQGWELFKHLATIRLHCRKYLSFPHAAIHDDSTPGPAAQPYGPTGTRRNRNRMRNLTTNPFLLLECQTLGMPDATTHDLVSGGQIRAAFLHRLDEPRAILAPELLELLAETCDDPWHALLQGAHQLRGGGLLTGDFRSLAAAVPDDGRVRFSGRNPVVIVLGDFLIGPEIGRAHV